MNDSNIPEMLLVKSKEVQADELCISNRIITNIKFGIPRSEDVR